MGNTNHRSFRNRRVTNDGVFQIDRGDPFTAGLDDILGAVRDLHVAVRVDGGDVAGIEPTVAVEDWAAFTAKVATGDPRAFDQQMTECLAITRQAPALVIDDLHRHTIGSATLLALQIKALFEARIDMFGQRMADGAHR
ncbi:hypothetical protein D3C76_1410120 [compost metagenome]